MSKKPNKDRRKELLAKLGELFYKIGLAQAEIKSQQTIIHGLNVQANGVATEIEKENG